MDCQFKPCVRRAGIETFFLDCAVTMGWVFIDTFAEKRGETRSGLLTAAALEYIHTHTQEVA
jgi:hypothetical protein